MEGYDPGSRLLFKPDGEVFPPIPDRPTKDQAQAALKVLGEPIKTFPFKSNVDKAVVLSMFLTGLCRRVLDFAPLHGMSATAAGTGKSLLVDLASILMSGREAPVISIDSSREEIEKRLGRGYDRRVRQLQCTDQQPDDMPGADAAMGPGSHSRPVAPSRHADIGAADRHRQQPDPRR
jgi:hypothetical protein